MSDDAPSSTGLSRLRAAFWWGLAGAWTCVVFALCLAQGRWVKDQLRWLLSLHDDLHLPTPRPTDTALHFSMFLVLGLLYACSLGQGSWARLRGGVVCLCMLGLYALGGGLEWAQSFVPERTPDWTDFAANVAGVTLGLGVPLVLGTAWRRWRDGESLLPTPWRG